jgi:Ran-binding protein 1
LFRHFSKRILYYSKMADAAEAKVDPSTAPSTDPESKVSPPETASPAQPKTEEGEVKTEDSAEKSSYTTMASNAASTGIAAATGVKDSVFSMFGGGAKKEKKEEPEEEADEPSGSTKANKTEDGVSLSPNPIIQS